MFESLFNPEMYLTQIERLRTKAKRRGRRRSARHDLSPFEAAGREVALCERLALEVRRGEYRFSPLSRVTAWHDGKRRVIHRPGFVDALVLGAMARRLTSLLEATLDDCVHAYRPGRGSQRTLARVCEYLTLHRNARPDVRTRGVFVLQRDLSAYGESIPTAPTSQLWPLIARLLDTVTDRAEAHTLQALLASGCCPEIKLPTNEIVVMRHGLPTGSPIQQPLANLYLTPLDRAIREVEPEFYARFGDDLLVLDSDVGRATTAAAVMERVTTQLGLTWSPTKVHNLYFTQPGRPYAGRSSVAFKPTSHVEYLGARLTFHGRLGLKRKRMRQLLQRFRWRIQNTLKVVPAAQALEPTARSLQQALCSPMGVGEPLVDALRTWVDDRAQLRQLDRQMAQMCAEALSGVRGVRAFRHVRAKALRDSGLRSVLQLRRRLGGAK